MLRFASILSLLSFRIPRKARITPGAVGKGLLCRSHQAVRICFEKCEPSFWGLDQPTVASAMIIVKQKGINDLSLSLNVSRQQRPGPRLRANTTGCARGCGTRRKEPTEPLQAAFLTSMSPPRRPTSPEAQCAFVSSPPLPAAASFSRDMRKRIKKAELLIGQPCEVDGLDRGLHSLRRPPIAAIQYGRSCSDTGRT